VSRTDVVFLQLLGPPKSFPDSAWRAETSIGEVRRLVADGKNDGHGAKADLHVFFCADQKYQGTVGIAYVGGICDTAGYACSLNEWRSSVAASGKVVAHEMGHNFGLNHDFSARHKERGCTGVMDYDKNAPDSWSACSVDDFVANYELVSMAMGGSHCMDVVQYDGNLANAGSGGQFESDSSEEEEEDVPSSNEIDEEELDGQNCEFPSFSGDGYCDDGNNSEECGFDGGDCCASEKKDEWDKYCTECACKEPPPPGAACQSPNWRGDGFCDDENNVAKCDWDGGDCCFSEKKEWQHFCTKCRCLDPASGGPGEA